jgi:hypothetical protein
MKRLALNLAMITTMAASSAVAKNDRVNRVDSEASLRAAIEAANYDSTIKSIIFKKGTKISLHAPVIYTGHQALTVYGNGSEIDGSLAGHFELDGNLTAITEDGSLVFNTASNITIHKLTVSHSATRGIVINIPADAHDKDIEVTLDKVIISHSALYGLHIDDNADDFDEGFVGSDIGIDLKISQSSFIGNGTGAIDFDGIRVDERGKGDIHAVIMQTHIDGNGGDGIELDEAGEGDVYASMMHVTLNGNGFYNAADLDDGFDIDEADAGSIEVNLFDVEVNDNQDEGLDFDEAGEGHIHAVLRKITAQNNFNEAIKIDEEDAGDIAARMTKIDASNNGDDGIQLTESGEGKIISNLHQVTADNNNKYGIKMEQWVVEDEEESIEPAGKLTVKRVEMSGNGNGDDVKINNVMLMKK